MPNPVEMWKSAFLTGVQLGSLKLRTASRSQPWNLLGWCCPAEVTVTVTVQRSTAMLSRFAKAMGFPSLLVHIQPVEHPQHILNRPDTQETDASQTGLSAKKWRETVRNSYFSKKICLVSNTERHWAWTHWASNMFATLCSFRRKYGEDITSTKSFNWTLLLWSKENRDATVQRCF